MAKSDSEAEVDTATASAAGRAGLLTYAIILTVSTISSLGSQISGLAVSIAVFRQTGHATPLALVSSISMAVLLVTMGFSGALADRFDRRKLMLVANLGFTACSGLLVAAFLSGAFHLWELYVLTFANALFGALAGPAYQASVAMLVSDRHRDRANAIQQLTSPAAGVIAPAAAGLLYAAFGVSGAITVDLATFVLTVAVLLVVRIPMPVRTEAGASLQGGLWRQSFDGFRYLLQRPALMGFCLCSCGVNFLVNGVVVLELPYLLDRVRSVAVFGVIIAVVNFGAVAGALFMGAWGGTRPRIHTALGGIVLCGVFLALSGVARTALTLTLGLGLFVFCLPIINAAATSILQAKVAADVQGRVMAAVGQMAMLLTPFALLAAGPLADRVFEPAARTGGWRAVAWLTGSGPGAGIGLMFVISGVATALLGLAVYALPNIRRIETILPDYLTDAG